MARKPEALVNPYLLHLFRALLHFEIKGTFLDVVNLPSETITHIANKLDKEYSTIAEKYNKDNVTEKSFNNIFKKYNLGYTNWEKFKRLEECEISRKADNCKKGLSELESPYNENHDLFKQINGAVQTIIEKRKKQNFKIKDYFNEYLQKIKQDDKYSKIKKLYVELLGQNYLEVDSIAIEKKDIIYDFEDFEEVDDENEDVEIEENEYISIRTDSVINIAIDTPIFVLIGIPGSGKTTTLKRIVSAQVEKIIEGESEHLPILIEAKLYEPNDFFVSEIVKNLSIEKEAVIERLQLGNFQILIDALNEIPDRYKVEANNHLKEFIENYPKNRFIISTRKIGFSDNLKLPVFELKNLEKLQIDKYIENYLTYLKKPFFREDWNSFYDDKRLGHFFKNPQTLLMFISIFINDGQIPKSRGNLYEGFTNSILKKEQEKISKVISIEEKVNVLSKFAFMLRQTGQLLLSEVEVRQFIRKESNNLSDTIFNELLDSLIIQKQLKGSLSYIEFIHETYLEYFVSIELKNQYIINNSLSINLEEDKWIEPLLMCSDLLPDDKIEKGIGKYSQYNFMQYLFVANTAYTPVEIEISFKESGDKYIKSLAVSNHFLVGCKIAFGLQYTLPKLFRQAELYLLNYTSLWSEKNNFVSLEYLFASIGAIGSKEVFKVILFTDKWTYLWLSDEKYDGNDSLDTLDVDNAHQQAESDFLSLLKILIENLSDIPLLYDLTQNIPSLFKNELRYLDSSIKKRLAKINDLLIQYLPIEKLKILFLEKKDKQILIKISSIDFDFFYENYNIEEWGSESYLKICLKYSNRNLHFSKELIEQYGEFISAKQLSKILKTLTHLLLIKQQYSEIDELFKKWNIPDNQKIIEGILELAIKNPFETLPKSLQVYFTEKYYKISNSLPEVILLSEEEIESKLNLSNPILMEYFDFYRKKNKPQKITFILDSSLSVTTPNFAKIKETSLTIKTNIEKKSVLYSNHFKSSMILLTNQNAHYSIKLNGRSTVYLVSGTITSTFDYIPENGVIEIYTIDPDLYKVYFKKKQTRTISLYDFYNYIHPDLIITDQKRIKLFNDNILTFEPIIRKLGIAHKFHTQIDLVHYGIITFINVNIITVFSISKQERLFIEVYPAAIDKYKLNQIVVIEENNTLGIIPDSEILNTPGFPGFVKSRIISLDFEINTGFIKKELGSKDYFFSVNDINFIPKINDEVIFVPSINFNAKYYGDPLAIKIHRIAEGSINECVITAVLDRGDHILVWATDLKNEKKLFNTISKSFLSKIKNIPINIESGQKYQYEQISLTLNDKGTYKVKLIEFIL